MHNEQKWLMRTLQITTIRCNELATIVPDQNNETCPFIKWKYVSTRAAKQQKHGISLKRQDLNFLKRFPKSSSLKILIKNK